MLADSLKWKPRRRFAPYPVNDRGNPMAMLHHKIGEVEQLVEFEGTRMNCQSARSCAGLCCLVDNAYFDTELCKPKRQNKAGRTGTDDQDVAVHRVILHLQSAIRGCWLSPERSSLIGPMGDRAR